MIYKFLYLISALLSLVILNSCSSARVISSPFDTVSDVAKERFFQNTWTKNGTREAEMKEYRKALKIDYYEWEFPKIKIYSQIYVKDYGDGKSKVWVYVKDCDSWWYPFSFSPSLATGVLDAFEKRLKWYKLGWAEMPWDKFNKPKK